MKFVPSVSTRSDIRQLSAPKTARVQVLAQDPFGRFARAAIAEEPQRIIIVSPWVSDLSGRRPSLGAVLEHASRSDAGVVLITRPAQSEAHKRAVREVASLSRGVVYLNPRVHAKLYVCEAVRTGGLAVIGSANCTDNSASLDELGLLVRPVRGSQVIKQLGREAVRSMSGTRLPHRPERSRR